MSTTSILLILKLVSEGVGVAKEIADLAKRIQAGEEITNAEIELARAQVAESVSNWDDSVKGNADSDE